MSAQDSPVWLITGCSKGLGRSLAETVLGSGARVVATARNPDSLSQLGPDDRTLKLPLDVDAPAQCSAVVEQTLARFGRIDVLVNNAGYGLAGAIEEISEEEARQQMETNFFGALRMTQAVLPIMRTAGRGHILQISSMAGLVSAPGLGLYNASKYALEGFSEALSLEVRPLGIHVTLIEPGPFRTEWAGSSMRHAARKLEVYAETAHKTIDTINGYSGRQPGNPEAAARLMMDIVADKKPPLRVALGKAAIIRVSDKLDRLRQDMDTWKERGLATDYPD